MVYNPEADELQMKKKKSVLQEIIQFLKRS
jgi:hypothetical protein